MTPPQDVLDSFKSDTNSTPVEKVDTLETPKSTPSNIGSVTKDEILKKLGTKPEVERFRKVIGDFDMSQIDDTTKTEMERLFGFIETIPDGEIPNQTADIQQYVIELKRLYDTALVEKELAIQDAKTASEAIIPNEFLTQSDNIFSEHIRDTLKNAESWTIPQLLEEAKGITIESKNIGTQEWDDFFNDLRDEISADDLAEFDTMVKEFKANNLNLYASGAIDRNVGSLIGVNIEGIGANLDTLIGEIEKQPDGNQIQVTIEDIEVTFGDKKSALLFIYKMKLVLQELSQNNSSLLGLLASYFWGIQKFGENIGSGVSEIMSSLTGGDGLASWLTYFITTSAALVVLNMNLIGGPIESGFRNTKDFLTVRFGNNNFSKVFDFIGNLAKKPESLIGKHLGKIPLVGGLLNFPFKMVSTVGGTVGGFGKNIFSGIEAGYVDPSTRGLRYTLLDGTINGNGDRNAEAFRKEEALRRLHVIEYYKQKWYFDSERLELLNGLDGTNGVIVSDTETFWIRIWEIDQGQYVSTKTGTTKLDNTLTRGKNLGQKALRVFSIPSFQEGVMKEYNTSVKRVVELFQILYDDVSLPSEDGKKVELDETKKSKIFKSLEAHIGLSQNIDASEEKARKGYLKDIVTAIKNGKYLPTADELKKELLHIAQGGFPKFKMLESLGTHIQTLTDSEEIGRFRKFMEMVHNGTWEGTKQEFEDAKTQIQNNTFDFKEKKRSSGTDFDKFIEKGDKLTKSIFSESIENKSNFLGYFDTERNIYGILNGEDALTRKDTELLKLYEDIKGKTDATGKVEKVDFTKSQVHYIFRKILNGSTYKDSVQDLHGEASDIETLYKDKNKLLQNDVTKLVDSLKTVDFDKQKEIFSKILEKDGLSKTLEAENTEYKKILGSFDSELKKGIDSQISTLRDIKTDLDEKIIPGDLNNPLVDERKRIILKVEAIEKDYLSRRNTLQSIEFLERIQKEYESIERSKIDFLRKLSSSTPTPPKAPTGAGPSPSTATTPTPVPTTKPPEKISLSMEQMEQMRVKAEDFADRIILETTLNGEKAPGDIRAIRKIIRDEIGKNISATTSPDDIENIILDIIRTHLKGNTSIPLDTKAVRSFEQISEDFKQRAIVNGITEDMIGKTPKLSAKGLLNLFEREIKPGKLLKFLL